MKHVTLATLATLATVTPTFAEEHHTASHHELHPMNEVGISGGCTYAVAHEEYAPILYMDYFRRFTATSKWAFGAAGEYVFAKHVPHLVLGVGARYIPIHRLHLAVLPGISVDFPKSHHSDAHGLATTHHETNHTSESSKKDVCFALQTEVCYEVLSFHHFHLAPTLGYSYSGTQGSHITLGVHVSFGF